MYQVQIYVEEVGEWYGWNGCPLQSTKAGAIKKAKEANRYGWETRVVKVK